MFICETNISIGQRAPSAEVGCLPSRSRPPRASWQKQAEEHGTNQRKDGFNYWFSITHRMEQSGWSENDELSGVALPFNLRGEDSFFLNMSILPSHKRPSLAAQQPIKMTNSDSLQGPSGVDIRRAYSDIGRLWLFSIVPLLITLVIFTSLLGSNSVSTSNQYILVLYESTRLLVPLQVAALVAPWNIGHIMKLCSYWVGYRLSLSRSLNYGVLTISDEQGTITSHLFFASPMTALMALWHACKPNESSMKSLGILRYFPGGPRGELGEYLTLTTSVLFVVAFSHLLFAGLVTLLAALTSMQTYEIITPIRIPMHNFGRVLPGSCLETKGESDGTFYSCGLEPVTGGFFLANSTESIRTVNNASSLNQVLYESQVSFYSAVLNAYSATVNGPDRIKSHY